MRRLLFAACRADQGVSFQPNCAEPEAPFAVQRVLVGDHPAIVKLRALIERVAPTEVTVLITGESGTGKEVVAQAIHAFSLISDAVRALHGGALRSPDPFDYKLGSAIVLIVNPRP